MGDLSFGRNYGIKCVEHSLCASPVLNVTAGVPTGVGSTRSSHALPKPLSFDVSQAAYVFGLIVLIYLFCLFLCVKVCMSFGFTELFLITI